MRPHIAHQRQIDRALIDAVEGLSSEIAGLAERGFAVEALTLHGLRDLQRRVAMPVAAEFDATREEAGDLAEEALDLQPPPSTDRGYPAAPPEPWSHEYNAAHAAFVGRALDDAKVVGAIAAGAPLPAGWGVGFDERVVEFPWLAGRGPAGTVLDAGSTLNHDYVLRRLRPQMDALHIVTLAPEERAFPKLGISYLFADLRELPMHDDVYDQVISLSTLEHVGLDLGHFGADVDLAEDPQSACLDAVDELRRVLRPGGAALLTVPVGRPERFGWVRSLSLDELDAVVERFEPVEVDVTYFRHDGGWQRAGREEVADARYRDHLAGEEPRGRVVAAEAVACVALTVGR
jgi:SAM-dependent methyltransferase